MDGCRADTGAEQAWGGSDPGGQEFRDRRDADRDLLLPSDSLN